MTRSHLSIHLSIALSVQTIEIAEITWCQRMDVPETPTVTVYFYIHPPAKTKLKIGDHGNG